MGAIYKDGHLYSANYTDEYGDGTSYNDLSAPKLKAIMSLTEVDNTSDEEKPLSKDMREALEQKADIKLMHTYGKYIRYNYLTRSLELYDANMQLISSTEIGGAGIAPDDIIEKTIQAGDKSVMIYWIDPEDKYADGQCISRWQGTRLVYKVGSYPTGPNDGVIVCDSQIRNQYSPLNGGFRLDRLVNGLTYHFQLFPYTDTYAFNTNLSNRFTVVPIGHNIMSIDIDLNNPNPMTCCEYNNDGTLALKQADPNWDLFFNWKPCLLKNGEVVSYLDKEDYSLSEDGKTTYDIENGEDGDVMIEFPRMGLNIDYNEEKNILKITMTDNANDPNFKYYAHTRDGDQDRDKFYIGAYQGRINEEGTYLRSINQPPLRITWPIRMAKNAANNIYIGYNILSYYQLLYIQAMFILKYKTLDAQAVGPDIFGMKDFWSNVPQYIDGIRMSGGNLMTCLLHDFRYGNRCKMETSGVNFVKRVHGTTEAGFIIKEGGGSNSTYFCDTSEIAADPDNEYIATLGSSEDNTDNGLFNLDLKYPASESISCNARLMYI